MKKQIIFVLLTPVFGHLSSQAAALQHINSNDLALAELVVLGARQITLELLINEYKNKLPNGIDPKAIIKQANQELGDIADKIRILEQQLEQAGYSQSRIHDAVAEQIFELEIFTPEQIEQMENIINDNSVGSIAII